MELPEIYFATHNLHKIEEVANILSGLYEVKGLNDLNLKKEIPETGTTLEENSSIKARYLFENFQINCFADDTGLEVETLNGAPGVLSARYAGEQSAYDKNNALLLSRMELLRDEKRFAFFICIVVFYDGKNVIFSEGRAKGMIINQLKGEGGFGYDPLFYYPEAGKTFAEMELKEKNLVSHRSRALQGLTEKLRKTLG